MRLCCCKRQNIKKYIDACRIGNIPYIKNYISDFPDTDIQLGLVCAVHNGQMELVEYLLPKTDMDLNLLDECLKIASTKNYSRLCELLVQKGADPRIGIRNTTSTNIINLLSPYIK